MAEEKLFEPDEVFDKEPEPGIDNFIPEDLKGILNLVRDLIKPSSMSFIPGPMARLHLEQKAVVLDMTENGMQSTLNDHFEEDWYISPGAVFQSPHHSKVLFILSREKKGEEQS